MGSIAQGVSTSAISATNSPNTEPATAQQAANSQPEVSPFHTHDTVNLTETGSRNVFFDLLGTSASAAFQVAYSPSSKLSGAQVSGSNSTSASQSAVRPVGVSGSASPAAQLASTAAQATANASVTGTSAAAKESALTQQSATSLSPASQAKLAQLNQVLQSLGINPAQISFADRLALLPLVNDPQALQQFVQGLPQHTAVLNPATSQVSAPSLTSAQTSQSPSIASNVATSTQDPTLTSASATAANVPATSSAPAQIGGEPVHTSARTHDRIGRNVNISV